MRVDLNDITRRLGHWLAVHGLPTEGVSLTIEFPKNHDVFLAQDAIRRELEPLCQFHGLRSSFGYAATMNGIGLTLRSKQP